MKPRGGAASSPLTWILALGFFAAIQAALAQLLWAPVEFGPMPLERMHRVQTLRVVKRLLAPVFTAENTVVLLGNSRMWFPARETLVSQELERLAPDLELRVENMAVFGARIGDLEAICRHLGRIDPVLAVLAVGGDELLPRSTGELGSGPARALDVGWRDDPLRPRSFVGRLDRWLRTAWPFYRFRVFEAHQLQERIWPRRNARRFPDRFASSREFHAFMHGRRADAIDLSFQLWRGNGRLDGFVAYLQAKGEEVRGREDARAPDDVLDRNGGRALALLGRALGHLEAQGIPALVLIMPENPILEEDVEGRYHRPGFSELAARRIREVASARGATVVDGRRWLPATSFFDFVHLMPDVGGFHEPLAREIVHAVRNR